MIETIRNCCFESEDDSRYVCYDAIVLFRFVFGILIRLTGAQCICVKTSVPEAMRPPNCSSKCGRGIFLGMQDMLIGQKVHVQKYFSMWRCLKPHLQRAKIYEYAFEITLELLGCQSHTQLESALVFEKVSGIYDCSKYALFVATFFRYAADGN